MVIGEHASYVQRFENHGLGTAGDLVTDLVDKVFAYVGDPTL
jgi:hypothetical protein